MNTNYFDCIRRMRESQPRVHCLTNSVTMSDVANVLLAAGGSAIMGSHPAEAAEITCTRMPVSVSVTSHASRPKSYSTDS